MQRKAAAERDAATAHPSFREALRTWRRIALLSFGGPAGQIAVMHRILVDEKRWISGGAMAAVLAIVLQAWCGWRGER